jgi:hypothetical protein
MTIMVIPEEDREFLAGELRKNRLELSLPAANRMSAGSADLIVEVVGQVGNAAIWGALATVLVSYFKNKSKRRVTVKTKSGSVIELEGLSVKEVEKVLEIADSIKIKKFPRD